MQLRKPDAEAENQAGHEILRAPTEGWWASVLAGQPAESHPVHARLKARVDEGVLLLEGSVSSQEERLAVEEEAGRILSGEVNRIDNQLAVTPETQDIAGVLRQTVVAAFKSEADAEVARRSLVQHLPDLQPELLLEGNAPDLPQRVPQEYASDVETMLKAGHAVLVVEADETDAFRLRQFLEEETNSVEVLTTPPSIQDQSGQ